MISSLRLRPLSPARPPSRPRRSARALRVLGLVGLLGLLAPALPMGAPATAAPPAATASTGTDTLAVGGSLVAGQSLRSADGRYQLVAQSDGNVVVYNGSRVVWHAGTVGNPGSRLIVQSDGNVVVYSASGRAVWWTASFGSAAQLVLQNDGNLVVYLGGRAAWASGADAPVELGVGARLTPGSQLRSPSGAYRLVLQGDGNLVGYGPAGAGWATSTAGRPATTLVLQADGNLVLYEAGGRPLWHAATFGSGASRLVLQDDANLVLYTADGRPVWNRRLAFAAWSRPLTAAEQAAMTGVTWRAGCPVPLSDLRLVALTYIDFAGEPRDGALVVRSSVVGDVTEVFAMLYAERFPIRSMVPIEAFGGNDRASMAADNTSAFNCRTVAGSTSWSRHAYGTAIDINPVENPWLSGGSVQPPAGAGYRDRRDIRPGMLVAGGTAVREFEARGWQWGGRWTAPIDYQHVDR